MAQVGPRTAQNWVEGGNVPDSTNLITLMAECEEVLDEVLRMAGKGDLAQLVDNTRPRGGAEAGLKRRVVVVSLIVDFHGWHGVGTGSDRFTKELRLGFLTLIHEPGSVPSMIIDLENTIEEAGDKADQFLDKTDRAIREIRAAAGSVT